MTSFPHRLTTVLVAFGAVTALTVLPAGAQQDRGFEPADVHRLVHVSDVAVSPGGDRVAYTVVRTLEEEDRRIRQIWIRELRNGAPRGEPFRLTAPHADSHSPRWSPDGSLLSFISDRPGDPNPVWFLRIGGAGGEAFHLEGVEGPPVWSPDGRWVAYLKDPARERSGGGSPPDDGLGLRNPPDAVTSAADDDGFRGRVITHLPYRTADGEDFVPHPATRTGRQLFVVPAEGGEARQLTSMDGGVAGAEWGADGRRIFFTAGRHLDRPFEPGSSASIWSVSRDDGEARRITGSVRYQRDPTVSPDGNRIVFLDRSEPGAHADLRVAELDANGGPQSRATTLTADFEGDPERPRWSADGEAVHFASRDGGSRHLYRVALEEGRAEPVTTGARHLDDFSFSGDGRVLAYVASDPATPPEVHVARGDGSGEERITALNRDWLEGLRLPDAERITWRSDDSVRVEGWVLPPADRSPGGEHPLVLALRSERSGASGHRFAPLHQMLSGAGFFVIYGNPRGSAGYGQDFEVSIRERWGILEKEDLASGIRAALEQYPQAADRVGVVGHGYGGFLATWLTATSDRFAAAVASSPVVDWVSLYGTSTQRSRLEREFGTRPWERPEVYRRLSPLSFVENVTAPTLVVLGEGDHRYPPFQAEEWYTALHRRDVPTEMIRYPGVFHDLSGSGKPAHAVDRLERVRGWLLRWLADPAAGSRVSQDSP